MVATRSKAEWWQVLRYYQAGLINIIFGYALFAILVWVGMHVFVAQAVGHVIGVLFNYVTYSRLAFAGYEASKINFATSYIANYLLSLAGLWVSLRVIPSPYIAGAVSVLAVSIINYVILKRLVFRARSENS